MRIIIDPKEEKELILKKEFIFIDFNQIKTLSDYKKFIMVKIIENYTWN